MGGLFARQSVTVRTVWVRTDSGPEVAGVLLKMFCLANFVLYFLPVNPLANRSCSSETVFGYSNFVGVGVSAIPAARVC